MTNTPAQTPTNAEATPDTSATASVDKYDVLVIGFGKAGKTIAMKRAKAGDKVAVIERSPKMYGGTCINIGCVPTKTLITQVHELIGAAASCQHAQTDGDAVWAAAQAKRHGLIDKMNGANLAMVRNTGAEVIDGEAQFVGPHQVQVAGRVLEAETIIINTGAESVKLPIPGADLDTVVDSTGIQFVQHRPKRLAIVGAGPIALEFGSLFAQLGTEVTLLDKSETFLPRTDQVVATKVREHLADNGVTWLSGVDIQSFSKQGEDTVVSYKANNEDKTLAVDLVLVAVGRAAATKALNLDAAGIETTDRGAVVVNDHLQTSVEGVYAAGDVAGSPQFTYISFDDHRVIMDDRWGAGSRSTSGRIIPTTTFINPPMATVGRTPEELTNDGVAFNVKEAMIADVAVMPRPKIVGNAAGMARILVGEDDQILGATLWCIDSQELINTVAIAMRHGITATELGQEIYTHPASHELFNGLLG